MIYPIFNHCNWQKGSFICLNLMIDCVSAILPQPPLPLNILSFGSAPLSFELFVLACHLITVYIISVSIWLPRTNFWTNNGDTYLTCCWRTNAKHTWFIFYLYSLLEIKESYGGKKEKPYLIFCYSLLVWKCRRLELIYYGRI